MKKPISESLHLFSRSLLPQQIQTYRTFKDSLPSLYGVPYIASITIYPIGIIICPEASTQTVSTFNTLIRNAAVSWCIFLRSLLCSPLSFKTKALWCLQFSRQSGGRFLLGRLFISQSSKRQTVGFVRSTVMRKAFTPAKSTPRHQGKPQHRKPFIIVPYALSKWYSNNFCRADFCLCADY